MKFIATTAPVVPVEILHIGVVKSEINNRNAYFYSNEFICRIKENCRDFKPGFIWCAFMRGHIERRGNKSNNISLAVVLYAILNSWEFPE